MSFNIVEGLLESPEENRFFEQFVTGSLNDISLLCKIYEIISDDSKYKAVLTEKIRMKLFRLAKQYFDNAFIPSSDNLSQTDRLGNLIDYSKTIIYYTDASNGKRISTEGEVKNGVIKLIPEYTDVLTVDEYEHLNLLLWCIYGGMRFYKRAGLECHYEDKKLKETDYELILNAGKKLRALIDWISDYSNYYNALNKLRAAKKYKYQYPAYAEDEITCNDTVKKVVYACRLKLLGKVVNERFKPAQLICIRMDTYKYKPLPHEIGVLRQAYDLIAEGENPSTAILPDEVIKLCLIIEDAVAKKIIPASSFSLKIVSTVKKYGKCSEKQLKILQEEKANIDSKVKTIKSKDKSLQIDSGDSDDETKDLFSFMEVLNSSEVLGEV